jgi:hypothetical protein
MAEGLGQLGFWLMAGMIVAATIVAGAIRQRDKEREKQATLRALLEREGTAVTEVLAYLREKDAAEAAEAARERARSDETMKRWKRTSKVAFGIFAFAAGIYAFAALRFGLFHGSGSVLIPLVAMFGIWGLGVLVGWPRWRSAKQKNDPHRAA